MLDLHTHSDKSDGTLSPAELIKKAAGTGLRAIALTDHDTVAGLDEAAFEAASQNIIFIPGIELSVEFPYGEMHMLGLGLKTWNGDINDRLTEIIENRNKRNRIIINRIRSAGIDITYKEVEALTQGTIGRPHIAEMLVKKGAAYSIHDAFQNYLGTGKPFYEPRVLFTPEKALELINAAGGISVIAHPLSMRHSLDSISEKLVQWKEMGIKGIETYQPGATAAKCRKLEKMSRKMGFIITGGSDFHGRNKPERVLGRAAGGKKIPSELLEQFPAWEL